MHLPYWNSTQKAKTRKLKNINIIVLSLFQRHIKERQRKGMYSKNYMPSSYLLVMPYAGGSGGNPVSGISLNDGANVNVTLLGRFCAR